MFLATDDSKLANVCEDMRRMDQVGEIVVKIYRGGKIEDIDGNPATPAVNLGGAETSVHEKALKGGAKSHSAS